MCLIMTIAAAIVFGILFGFSKKGSANKKALFTTFLMFAAAALMWSVDGIASVMSGESFFDISIEDAFLGIIIVAAGTFVFFVLKFFEVKKIKAARA